MTSDDELLKAAENANDRLRAHGYDDYASVVIALAARFRELEAELDALKSDLSGYMGAANTYVNELHGVHSGTHVIVPVEPTEFMEDAAFDIFDANDPSMGDVYRAMIRAAQSGASD